MVARIQIVVLQVYSEKNESIDTRRWRIIEYIKSHPGTHLRKVQIYGRKCSHSIRVRIDLLLKEFSQIRVHHLS